ncbi:Ig-like domain repeat protein [Granulicella sp. L60]|uniref:NHL domain-containing protein n=1 Tax=Granulicella sp. L60 TaxID=1641866 RepID=UPI00131D9E72|nr:Ig-like domain repeat protein [Granulicella sp. L60]
MMSGLIKRLQPSVGISYSILALSFASSAFSQGILTVTPSRSAATVAGTGVVGYTGDGGTATSATLASPSAVAYDANGNLFFADAQNHVVREVSQNGQISTIAGTGAEGYSGDGGPAITAFLDTPTGVAVDAGGNVYIADSHNHRVRKVSAGTITTIAGTGTPGYFGDNGAATAAQLSLPIAVAVDSTGNVYIADTNNNRIRKIIGTTITTIAGNGEELFAGDGAAASAAVLDTPTGVAVDASGNVYIADRHNQRVRMITATGTISTIAGSGTPNFSGSFSGDGASASTATLAKPSGVSVDGAGNLYIADNGNQRIRQVSVGTIATVAGSGQQGFGGDSGPATSAILNSPRAAFADVSGNLTIADRLNERLRTAALPTLAFASGGGGIPSTPQSVTLTNTGSASIAVASIAFTGSFTTANGGSCSALPITLSPNASCTQNIAFLPIASGVANGSVVFGGTGIVAQSVLLTATGTQTATTVTLTSNAASAFVGQNITFTATVQPTGIGTPTGNVLFYDGATLIGTSALTAGSTSITTGLSAGIHAITAVYAGSASFTGNTSAVLSQVILDFAFTLGNTTPSSQTVVPGQPVSFTFSLVPVGAPFTIPITLSATGLPPGATATFTPQVITIGSNPVNFTMTIQTAATGASRAPTGLFGTGYGTGIFALSLLLLPYSRKRRKTGCIRLLALCTALALSLAAIGGLAGCGTGSGYFGQPSQNYTINVIGTATGQSGASLQHLSAVTLTVQ